MSDFLTQQHLAREPLQAAFSDASNPVALDGVEFIEYATPRPQALGQVLEMMGFRPIARHRSREVLLYRQGELNIVVNAHSAATDSSRRPMGEAVDTRPRMAAIALRVRDARAAYAYVLERGAWAVATHPEVMELNIPAIHGCGGSRLYFIDRYKEFSIYDVDFVPIPGVDQHPPAVAGLHFFGIVQYIGSDRSNDWITFYQALFGAQTIAPEARFGIMPQGTLLQFPALDPRRAFMMQLIEPEVTVLDGLEQLQRIGLGVPDVLAAVHALRDKGLDFVETVAAHTEARGAITKTYEGSVVFELVQSTQGCAPEVTGSTA